MRGVLYYENTWGAKPLREYGREEALRLVLRALDTAAEADTATGGVDRNGRIFPVVKIITAKGIETITDDTLRELFNAGRHPADATAFRRRAHRLRKAGTGREKTQKTQKKANAAVFPFFLFLRLFAAKKSFPDP